VKVDCHARKSFLLNESKQRISALTLTKSGYIGGRQSPSDTTISLFSPIGAGSSITELFEFAASNQILFTKCHEPKI
jgi:hypothetical protein